MNYAIVEYATPKIVQNYVRSQLEDIRRANQKKDAVLAAATFMAKINAKFGNILGYQYLSAWGVPTLELIVPVKGFTGEAAPELSELLEYLSEQFYYDPTSLDMPDQATRAYNFKAEDEDVRVVSVQVNAQLNEGDGLCQRVVVGTRKESRAVYVDVDVPTYSFKC